MGKYRVKEQQNRFFLESDLAWCRSKPINIRRVPLLGELAVYIRLNPDE